ncbi:peroxide stress protein YaaA [Sphingomonas morindae]|uniref:UPF0246 protein LHA26_00410 n=1 Tax=Sphingomonas morindae TaxID=1541170 RepID=A0ABY4X7T7_9SPHN|nr:peroxide stress protein YaaA [Sphingomonas morindae]USI72977.1 peroxide stress protein YaaA [Sphingomonas morindae]
MLALLSPAKTLDYERPLPEHVAATRPRLAKAAAALARAAAGLEAADLERLMGISESLATLNRDRFRGFARAPQRPALYAFAGDVYTGLEAHSLKEPAVRFAQDHLRILSGLYGLLRPLDAMRPYRLEMGTRWAPDAPSLYQHWDDRVASLLGRDLKAEGSGEIVNLASKEYWQVIAQAPPKARIVTVEFMEPGPKGPRIVSFHAKKARGMMARFLCEHRLARADDLKAFDSDGYRFAPDQSDEDRFRFLRG